MEKEKTFIEIFTKYKLFFSQAKHFKYSKKNVCLDLGTLSLYIQTGWLHYTYKLKKKFIFFLLQLSLSLSPSPPPPPLSQISQTLDTAALWVSSNHHHPNRQPPSRAVCHRSRFHHSFVVTTMILSSHCPPVSRVFR